MSNSDNPPNFSPYRYGPGSDCVTYPVRLSHTSTPRLNESKPPQYAIVPTKKKILLVEDNPINQKVVELALKHSGHQVTIVRNGKDAVNITKNQHFDLILMDIGLPDIDGRTAAQLIRKNERNHHTPIVAITAHPEDTVAQTKEGTPCSLDAIYTKPLSPKTLVQIVVHWTKK